MSFITKRERVFNEYDLFDLPSRNEGKLKAYASCTDARAWSHFCSDKTEHLVEIIKRNNETIRPKYLPTNVIVETLMVSKNAEIARLKHKIEEFEQLLAAYDHLDLSCDQKCEIANAHATIRAANKELDEMCLDLDLSGYTEVLDSEAFETGKSGGDGDEEPASQMKPKTETRSVQMGISCTNDIGLTCFIKDQRIDEMQDLIIVKDSKINAMNNTIAGMENDLCEPYCIYASIYTALEKIFGILCQNDKYRQYLVLQIASKDIRCLDIKGKILFKLKVLEKFCGALIAPCNRNFPTPNPIYESLCYRSEVNETTYAITSIEKIKNNFDNKRAHLVADIIQNEEINEILNKENLSAKSNDALCDDGYITKDYNVDTKNLERLKQLQEDYDDLIKCYESLKHEKEYLEIRCREYKELENEFKHLKLQIHEYNSLWSEKEHYQKRCMDLDALKERYIILSDETVNLETELKAQTEINHIKCVSIEELRQQNLILEKKLNEALIDSEKAKNNLLCKLNKAECRMMCQDQQIKSLSLQIDRFLKQDQETFNLREAEENSMALINEVESQKDQIKILKDTLFYNEEDNQNLQEQYQHQLKLINEMKIEIEDWKSVYEKILRRNEYLEEYTKALLAETKTLSRDVEEKSQAVENLINVINSKSQEINKLISESEKSKTEIRKLLQQIDELRNNFDQHNFMIQTEKIEVLNSLQTAKKESRELLETVQSYEQMLLSTSNNLLKCQNIYKESKSEAQVHLFNMADENKCLELNLPARESSHSILLKDIQEIHKVNTFAKSHINSLQEEIKTYKTSLELIQKESGQLKMKCKDFEYLAMELQKSQNLHENLIMEKKKLQNELHEKCYTLDITIHNLQVSKRENEELSDKLQQLKNIKAELTKRNELHQKLAEEKLNLKKELFDKKNEIQKLSKSLHDLKLCNEDLSQKCKHVRTSEKELQELKLTINQLLSEKKALESDYNNKREEVKNLYDTLEKKIKENQNFEKQIKCLEINQLKAENSMKTLENDKTTTQARLSVVKKESADKLKHYETLETELLQLKKSHELINVEKEKIKNELMVQLTDLKRIKRENNELHDHSQTLLSHIQVLENALISSRTEQLKNTTNKSYEQILKDIEELKRERLVNHKKIRNLQDKLEESENFVSYLNEDVMARDDKIAILQNYINELKDEVKQLQNNLHEMIVTGEQMRDVNLQNIKSIKNIEAHHSKATHNMKTEIAQLHKQNLKLEEQLSDIQLQSDKSSQHSKLVISKMNHLENEREIIVTDIKQLEIQTVGDSSLIPTKCDIQDISLSIDRIRDSFNNKISKNMSLEQTISKLKTSSHILLSKADEAKILAEKEKQKMINEKEDVIKDKEKMEKQFLEFKNKLENQKRDDLIKIKDLEASLLNQKLICNKINKEAMEYTAKLEDELQILQKLYHNAIENNCKLQTEVKNLSAENAQLKLLEEIKENFDQKSKEVFLLQKQLEEIKNKSVHNIETQTNSTNNECNVKAQINKEMSYSDKLQVQIDGKTTSYDDKKIKPSFGMKCNSTFLSKIKSKSQNDTYIREYPPQLNEVQILTANVEHKFDYARSNCNGHELQTLSTTNTKLQQHSVSELNAKKENKLSTITCLTDSSNNSLNNNLIYMPNSSFHTTNLFKTNGSITYLRGDKESQESKTLVQFTKIDANINKNYINSNKIDESKSSETKLFIIYKDGLSHFNNKDKVTWIETVGADITDYAQDMIKSNNNLGIQQKKIFYSEQEENENNKDNSIKNKLNIRIPILDIEGDSLKTVTDGSKKSLDTYTMTRYSIATRSISLSRLEIIVNNDSVKSLYTTPSLAAIPLERTLYCHENFKEDSINYKISASKALDTDSSISKKTHEMSTLVDIVLKTDETKSHHNLSRVKANVLLLENDKNIKFSNKSIERTIADFRFQCILDSIKGKVNTIKNDDATLQTQIIRRNDVFERINKSEDNLNVSQLNYCNKCSKLITNPKIGICNKNTKKYSEQGVMAILNTNIDYENTINSLTKVLENIEKDYKKKIEAIKVQYDINIKSIIKEHNQGVKSLQNLHEDTLQDIIKTHENEVENLRSMSTEAMRKTDLLKKENHDLKMKVKNLDAINTKEEPTKILPHEEKKRKKRRGQAKLLTKTTVEAFNVNPKTPCQGPCTCSLDISISDTIRNIFDQVDDEQRKMAEYTYMKYVANKILSGDIENLDAQELSFLHLKICRMWKNKLHKEEALQKRIDSLESELIHKQRNTQQHIAELDRKVAEERRRLQEVREAICRKSTQGSSRPCISDNKSTLCQQLPDADADKDSITTFMTPCDAGVSDRCSAGDLVYRNVGIRTRPKTTTVLSRSDVEERRGKRLYNDEPPTRLRRSHDRQMRCKK